MATVENYNCLVKFYAIQREDSKRFGKIQKNSKRFGKIQKDLIRFKKVRKDSKIFEKIQKDSLKILLAMF